MTESSSFKYGQRVRFTVDCLGIINPDIHPNRFLPETVSVGDEGEVVATPALAPIGWISVEPDGFEGCYVPVHPDMIEPA